MVYANERVFFFIRSELLQLLRMLPMLQMRQLLHMRQLLQKPSSLSPTTRDVVPIDLFGRSWPSLQGGMVGGDIGRLDWSDISVLPLA